MSCRPSVDWSNGDDTNYVLAWAGRSIQMRDTLCVFESMNNEGIDRDGCVMIVFEENSVKP